MELNEIKRYALVGLLVRINAEKEKLQIATTKERKKEIQQRIERLSKQYDELLSDIQTIPKERYWKKVSKPIDKYNRMWYTNSSKRNEGMFWYQKKESVV